MFVERRLEDSRVNGRRNLKLKKEVTMTLVVLVVLLLAMTTEKSLAYYIAKTSVVKNVFDPGTVSCEVLETFDGAYKTDVRVKNNGNVDEYMRVAVVVTWMSDDGSTVYATVPQENIDYNITYTSDTRWFKGSDGYWYYTDSLESGSETAILFTDCSMIDGQGVDGYHLSVEIVSSVIQADPADAVNESWSSVTVDANGKLVTR